MISKKEFFKKLEKDFNISNAFLEDFFCDLFQISKKELFNQEFLKSSHTSRFLENIKKYKNHVPYEYLVKKASFFGRNFFVNENVLIPRQDSETLIYAVQNFLKNNKNVEMKKISSHKFHDSESSSEGQNRKEVNNFEFYDFGCGSGILGITASLELNLDKINFIDISENALEVTKINSKKLLENKIVKFSIGDVTDFDFLSAIFEKTDKCDIIILANLPYIKDKDFENLSKNTSFEPSLALFGGEKTGFEIYEKLILNLLELKNILNKNFYLFIEIGFDQKEISEDFLKQKNISEFEFVKDSGNIQRCIFIKL